MAKEPGSEQPPDPIKLEIERSRGRVAREVSGLRYELDFPAKLRRSFQHNTMVWVGVAVAVGAVLVYFPNSRKTVYVDVERGGKKKRKMLEAGFLLGALRIAATLLKPALLTFVKNKMSGDGASAFSRGPRKW